MTPIILVKVQSHIATVFLHITTIGLTAPAVIQEKDAYNDNKNLKNSHIKPRGRCYRGIKVCEGHFPTEENAARPV